MISIEDSDKPSRGLWYHVRHIFACSKAQKRAIQRAAYIDREESKIINKFEHFTDQPIIFDYEANQNREEIWFGETAPQNLKTELAKLKANLNMNYNIDSALEKRMVNLSTIQKTDEQPELNSFYTKFAKNKARLIRNQTKFRYKLI